MSAAAYQFKLATTVLEVSAYYALRHDIFVNEQALFLDHDIDDIDAIAYPIISIHNAENNLIDTVGNVVGIVRIYEKLPRLWYGGRLGTHRDYRRGWQIGKGLIEKAVTTANTWGCDQFLATVQPQNVRFFERLHWRSLKEISLLNRPHHLMEADLAYYPPNAEIRPRLTLEQEAC